LFWWENLRVATPWPILSVHSKPTMTRGDLIASCSKKESTGLSEAKKTDTDQKRDLMRGPVIDSHTLIAPDDESMGRAVALFDKVGVTKFCNKNAGYLGSKRFEQTLRVKERLKGRFAFFANPDWKGVDDEGWGDREAKRLNEEVRLGAKGLKIFKVLGLTLRDSQGKLLHVNDRRLDPIFEAAAKLNAIIAIHTGDPKAFFEPPTPDNERYEELQLAPGWSFFGKDYPPRDQLLAERDDILARHPKTTFLLIHLANKPEDIDYAASLLDRFPNVFVDTSARVPEFGRLPTEKLRAFFVKYQNRILFGTDFGVSHDSYHLGSVSKTKTTFDDAVEFYRAHYRFFETDLKQIDHPTPIQGRWKVNAVHLPESVLRKLYYENADKLIFERKTTPDPPPVQ
jgi:predicted TIM-barrel fold metal-dependent hydrolase